MTRARRARRILAPTAARAPFPYAAGLLGIGLLGLCHAAGALAGPLAGRLGSPTDYVPALTVHAWSEATGHRATVTTEPGQTAYVLDVPPGRYLVFATPADPGAPPVYGAHTRFTLCARDAARLQAGACGDHALVEVEVGRRRVDGVDLTDWYLDDATVARIDRILGRRGESWTEATLAAPKFSEYPGTRVGAALALQPSDDPRVERDRAVLAPALARPANFAGGYALVRVPCGDDPAAAAKGGRGTRAGPGADERCEGAALVEFATGRVHYPDVLNPLPAADPCLVGGVLQFRRDSRLLTITAASGSELVTRYLVWNPATSTLTAVATLSSERAERCAAPPR